MTACFDDCPRFAVGSITEAPLSPLEDLYAPTPGREPENAPCTPLQGLQDRFRPFVVGVHGLFSQGTDSTDLFLTKMADRGYDTEEFDWGPRPAIWASLFCGLYARRLVRALEGRDRVHVVAHSFGPRIVLEAMKRGRKFGHCYFFNAALPSAIEFPEGMYESITVIANRHDNVLRNGKLFFRLLGFGKLGQNGYLGNSPRVSTHFDNSGGVPGAHNHAFTRMLGKWADHFDRTLATATLCLEETQ